MKRLIVDPLFHFLLLGAAIFAVYSVMGDESPGQDESILVSQNRIDSLVMAFERSWLRAPTKTEINGLIEDYVREEIAVREAVLMGLDLNDNVIRRLLRRKFEFVATDLTSLVEPEESELKAYLNANPDQFRSQSRFTFRHIYFNPQQHSASLSSDIEKLVGRFNSDNVETDIGSIGDVTSLERGFTALAHADMVQIFGETFASEVAKLKVGQWSGPIASEFGLHLVFLAAAQPGVVPEFEEVRDAVMREMLYTRAQDAIDQLYQQLFQRYAVTVEPVSAATQSSLLAVQKP